MINDSNDIITSFGSNAVHKLKFSEEFIELLRENMLYLHLENDEPVYACDDKTLVVEAIYPIYDANKKMGALILIEAKKPCNNEQLKGLELLAHIYIAYLSEEKNS